MIFLLLYFGIIIGLRSAILYKKVKINAIRGFGEKSKTKKAERIIQAALILMMIIALNYIFIPSNYRYFLPLDALDIGWIKTSGFIISVLGLAFTFVAQLQMKNSWRLGIDEKTALVTTKLFSISRNPIYLGLGIGFVGFFFIAPNIGSLLFLILMFYGVTLKIIDEEQFLSQEFGDAFKQYKSKVNRWI